MAGSERVSDEAHGAIEGCVVRDTGGINDERYDHQDRIRSSDRVRRRRSGPQRVSADAPVILVVGGSRTGTTVVLQVLANRLAVSTTSNVVDVFPRAPLTASRLLRALAGSHTRPASGYHSYYGNTTRLRDPGDAFEIWNRWLGVDRYRPAAALDAANVAEMRRFFTAWTAAAGLPLINKNNRNAGAIGILANALPTAHFVVVRRDPIYVAQSLLIAREAVQGDRAIGWGFEGATVGNDPIDAVAAQVAAAERTISDQEAGVDGSRISRVRYEEFCADPAVTVSSIGRTLEIPFDTSGLHALAVSRSQRLPPEEFARLAASVKRHLGG